MKKTLFALSITLFLSANSQLYARDQIKIVGSSTVYPFATVVAERFGKTSGFKTPVIESTGSGGGLKLFCSGLGTEHPDITNASRRIKSKEVNKCAENGVEDITEIKVGYDGIALANSKSGPSLKLSLKEVYLALAKVVPADPEGETVKPNPYKMWNEINPSLPAKPIVVIGPPPTSGTRDAMGSLFMKAGMKMLGLETYKKLREDGLAIEMGENDNLIIEKLASDPNMFGIFGYSFFDTNRDKVQASVVDGVELSFENISSYSYPGSRPLFFYVKKAHVGVIPGLKEFVEEFISEKAMSMDGYLYPAGLVPLSDEDFATQTANLNNL